MPDPTFTRQQESSLAQEFNTEVLAQAGEVDPGSELDWFALTVGWCLAKGAPAERAHAIASHIRYGSPIA